MQKIVPSRGHSVPRAAEGMMHDRKTRSQEFSVPVTARLSKHFYDRLGEEIANELVDWFNQVDATYRGDLRELNELNFARFDAKMEQRLAEFEAKLERRLAQLEAMLERRLGEQTRWLFVALAAQSAVMIGGFIAILSRT